MMFYVIVNNAGPFTLKNNYNLYNCWYRDIFFVHDRNIVGSPSVSV